MARARRKTKPLRAMYEVTYADRTKGLVGCEKFEVLEGGVIAFYSNLSDRFPRSVISPTFYRKILLMP